MPERHPSISPSLILGTAMWGWTSSKETAFVLLDEWYAQGFREVDGAMNYPIDKNPLHFRLAESILREWIQAHGVGDLKVMMKIGSVNNLRTPEHVLSHSLALILLDEYRWLFGSNLDTLMVHWDNREEERAIRETLEAFEKVREFGLKVGLSGIRYPEIYAKLNREYRFDFRIQLKHNVLQSDYGRYAPFHGKRRFIAYGINAGGLKLNPGAYTSGSSLAARGGDTATEPPVVEKIRQIMAQANAKGDRPRLQSMNEIGMIYAFYQPDMQGILLGVSSLEQLKSSLSFYEVLKACDFRDVFEALSGLLR